MKSRHTSLGFALAAAGIVILASQAQAGTNDFFGSSIGGGQDPNAVPGANAAAQAAANAGGDYTVDEKRMQKKFKSNVRSAQDLIAKGTKMMKSKDQKTSKKGKIFKEIGEKRLAELKANSPFPEVADRPDKKGL
jgi:3-oxoacyl-ACP reductase-like protein